MTYDERQLLSDIGRELGHPLTDTEVAFLARGNRLQDARTDIEHGVSQADVVQELKQVLRDGRHRTTARVEPPDQGANRAYALSVFYAHEAAEDGSVQWFREEVLGGRLLTYAEVGTWVKEQAKTEEVVRYATVPFPPGVVAAARGTEDGTFKIEPPINLSEWPGRYGAHMRVKMLYYGTPEGKAVQSAPTGSGVLNDLRQIGESLAKYYGWTADAATMFILTGMVQLASTIRIEVTQDMIDPERSRIILTVDPTVKPEQVAAAYARERKKLIGDRYRPQGQRYMQLLVFGAEERAKGATWAEVCGRWNAAYPQWAYPNADRIGQDYREARRRALLLDKQTETGNP